MRKGFTLIELIVAMGIILILGSLAVWGISSVLEHQRASNTRTTLAAVNGILSQRVRAIGNNVFPAEWYLNGVYGNHNTAGPGMWLAIDRHYNASNNIVYSPLTLTDTAVPDDYTLWQSDLLRNTVIIFNDLDRSAESRKALDAMQTLVVNVPINGAPMRARIPLDGWGRPVLFAPGVGITVDGVTVYQQSTAIQYTTDYKPSAVFPFAFSAGNEGNPSDMANIVR